MIHPNTQLRYINDHMGYGVFATAFIPQGTVVYVKDSLEIQISELDFQHYQEPFRSIVEKYSFIDETGHRIISWDHAKYVNHCCQCNTMSTAYGFEIAIRDIQAGEEITDEYGLFNLQYEMDLTCSRPGCRNKITPHDIDLLYGQWDETLKMALAQFRQVDQPLFPFIDSDVKEQLHAFFDQPERYRSVLELKWLGSKVAMNGQEYLL